MDNILYTILSLINLIRINLITFFIKKGKKKIIFFYHPRPKLTLIHKHYIEDMFKNFPERYKIIYGHQLFKLKQSNHFFIMEKHLRSLFNIDYFVSNNLCDHFSINSKKIYIHHNLYDDPWVSRENEKKMCERLNKYDHILMSANFSLKRIKQTFEKYKIKALPNFIEIGYAKLDYLIKNKTKTDKDSILIAPTGIKGFPDLSMKKYIIPIIENLLSCTEYKVILRPHPSDKDNIFFQDIKKKFNNKNKFEYDTSNNYLDVYLKSKIMITDLSGTAYTFALLNLTPVIFISLSENKLKELNYSNYDFFKDRDKIGEILNNPNEIEMIKNKILNNYEKYRNEISLLRNKINYFGKSYKEFEKFFNNI